jgi:bifunctional DNA-binding transcriptional regulator/antitoxin component of YhaV-PrlF toxin-antitoxin module
MESVVKLDSKGRILIPISFRKKLRIRADTELVLLPGEKMRELRMMPLCDQTAAKCRLLLTDSPQGLTNVMEVLEMLNVGVLMSESRSLMGNGTSEWTFVLDTSKSNEGHKDIESRLLSLNGVKSASLMNKKAEVSIR